MPLFDWSSPPGATGKFWIYWAITIPSTILVLVIWRVWYVFDEWRQANGTKASVYNDIRFWVNSWGRVPDQKDDLERGNTS